MTGPDQPGSGLRNPTAAVRGVGAAALASEGLVMLLAIVPLNVLGTANAAATTVTVVIFSVASFALAGLLRRGWAWYAGSVLQVALFVSGFILHVALAVLGVVFGLVWLYVLYVRRRVLR